MKRFCTISQRASLVILCLCCFGSATGALAAEENQLDAPKLKEMIENMGYDFSEKTFDNGRPYYSITDKRPTRTCYITLQLSSDKKFLWVTAELGSIPKEKTVPREILLKMLAANYDSLFVKFSYQPQLRQFRLEDALYNLEIKPLVLRQAIQNVGDMMILHEDTWNHNKWPAEESDANLESNNDEQDAKLNAAETREVSKPISLEE